MTRVPSTHQHCPVNQGETPACTQHRVASQSWRLSEDDYKSHCVTQCPDSSPDSWTTAPLPLFRKAVCDWPAPAQTPSTWKHRVLMEAEHRAPSTSSLHPDTLALIFSINSPSGPFIEFPLSCDSSPHYTGGECGHTLGRITDKPTVQHCVCPSLWPSPTFCWVIPFSSVFPAGGCSSLAMEELLKHLTKVSICQRQIMEHMAACQGESDKRSPRFTLPLPNSSGHAAPAKEDHTRRRRELCRDVRGHRDSISWVGFLLAVLLSPKKELI